MFLLAPSVISNTNLFKFFSSIGGATFVAVHRRFFPRQETGVKVVTERPRYDSTDPAPTETVVTVPLAARPTARYR